MRRWAQLPGSDGDEPDGRRAAEPGATMVVEGPLAVPSRADAASAQSAPRLTPQFLSAGTRHMLGYGPDYYGIWLRGRSREYPMQVFPRSDAGWDLAWGRFCDLEPQHAQTLGGLKWLVRKAH